LVISSFHLKLGVYSVLHRAIPPDPGLGTPADACQAFSEASEPNGVEIHVADRAIGKAPAQWKLHAQYFFIGQQQVGAVVNIF
jgi:hypothetical protein